MTALDSLRMVCVVLGAAMIFAVVRVLYERRKNHLSTWQQARFLSLIFAAISAIFTEIGLLHEHLSWHLLVDLCFVVSALLGVLAMRNGRDEIRHHRHDSTREVPPA